MPINIKFRLKQAARELIVILHVQLFRDAVLKTFVNAASLNPDLQAITTREILFDVLLVYLSL